MTISTFFPDGDTESTSVDGFVQNDDGDVIWDTVHGAATGSAADDSAALMDCGVIAGATMDQWNNILKLFLLFDTSALTDLALVSAATCELVATAEVDSLADEEPFALVASTPGSNVAVGTGDFDQLGTILQAANVDQDDIVVDSATYTPWTLNAAGLASISLDSITKFGLSPYASVIDTPPTWAGSNAQDKYTFATAEEVLSGDKRPKLVVTHTDNPAILMAMTGGMVVGSQQPELIATGMRPL